MERKLERKIGRETGRLGERGRQLHALKGQKVASDDGRREGKTHTRTQYTAGHSPGVSFCTEASLHIIHINFCACVCVCVCVLV